LWHESLAYLILAVETVFDVFREEGDVFPIGPEERIDLEPAIVDKLSAVGKKWRLNKSSIISHIKRVPD
jgi:hypothetical protein